MRIRVRNIDEEKDNDCSHADFLKEMESVILDITLCGIKGIDEFFLHKPYNITVDENGSITRQPEWELCILGSHLRATLNVPDADPKRTISNNIVEIVNTLGIEAARTSLLYELRNVYSFDGSYINYRHLSVLADVMTYRGHLLSISRGINRDGPLKRCSFEETVDMIVEAATFAEDDI